MTNAVDKRPYRQATWRKTYFGIGFCGDSWPTAPKPFQKLGRFAPHLLDGVLGRPWARNPNKSPPKTKHDTVRSFDVILALNTLYWSVEVPAQLRFRGGPAGVPGVHFSLVLLKKASHRRRCRLHKKGPNPRFVLVRTIILI